MEFAERLRKRDILQSSRSTERLEKNIESQYFNLYSTIHYSNFLYPNSRVYADYKIPSLFLFVFDCLN